MNKIILILGFIIMGLGWFEGLFLDSLDKAIFMLLVGLILVLQANGILLKDKY